MHVISFCTKIINMRRKNWRKSYTYRQHVDEYVSEKDHFGLREKFDIPLEKDFIKDLQYIRKTEGVTQKLLSERSGVTQAYISRLENRRVSPTLFIINKLANALGFEAKIIFKKTDK